MKKNIIFALFGIVFCFMMPSVADAADCEYGTNAEVFETNGRPSYDAMIEFGEDCNNRNRYYICDERNVGKYFYAAVSQTTYPDGGGQLITVTNDGDPDLFQCVITDDDAFWKKLDKKTSCPSCTYELYLEVGDRFIYISSEGEWLVPQSCESSICTQVGKTNGTIYGGTISSSNKKYVVFDGMACPDTGYYECNANKINNYIWANVIESDSGRWLIEPGTDSQKLLYCRKNSTTNDYEWVQIDKKTDSWNGKACKQVLTSCGTFYTNDLEWRDATCVLDDWQEVECCDHIYTTGQGEKKRPYNYVKDKKNYVRCSDETNKPLDKYSANQNVCQSDCGTVCSEVDISTQQMSGKKPWESGFDQQVIMSKYVYYWQGCQGEAKYYLCDANSNGKYIYAPINKQSGNAPWAIKNGGTYMLLHCNGSEWSMVTQRTTNWESNAQCSQVLTTCNTAIYVSDTEWYNKDCSTTQQNCDNSICTDATYSGQVEKLPWNNDGTQKTEDTVYFDDGCNNLSYYKCSADDNNGKYIGAYIGNKGELYPWVIQPSGTQKVLLFCDGTKWLQLTKKSSDWADNATCTQVLPSCKDKFYVNGNEWSDKDCKKIAPEKGQDNIKNQDCEPLHANVQASMRVLNDFVATADVSVWVNKDGKFNVARLGTDIASGVVLGTVGGLVSNAIIKKNQMEKGMDGYYCTVGDDIVADYGDEFTIGF